MSRAGMEEAVLEAVPLGFYSWRTKSSQQAGANEIQKIATKRATANDVGEENVRRKALRKVLLPL